MRTRLTVPAVKATKAISDAATAPGCNRGEAVSGAQQAVDGEGLGDSFGGNLARKDGPPNGPITMAAHPAQQVLCTQAQYVKPRATLYECSRTR